MSKNLQMSNNSISKFEEAVRLDNEASAVLPEIAEKYGDKLAHLWRYGDGRGGDILRSLAILLSEKGYFIDSPWIERGEKKASYQKKAISHGVRKAVFERDAYRCKHCGTHIDLCVDHIYPESLGGEITMDNLQTLCRSCNSKKGKKVSQ